MSVNQISVFLENKEGRLFRLINTLGEAGINLLAVSLSETREYGIFRAVTNDNKRAAEILAGAGYAVNVDELICVICPDKPSAVASLLKVLAESQVNVDYTYAFSRGIDAVILLKVTDAAKAEKILESMGIKTVSVF